MGIFKDINTRDLFIFIFIFFILLRIGIKRNDSSIQGVISSDTEGYYMYLPALFIQKSMHHIPEGSMNSRKNEKGETVIKYTCGVAYFSLPFFLAAHIYAHIFHYNTSGFSDPYGYALIICGVFWATMGLYLLRTLLLRFYSYTVTWITIISIMLGTNFFHYATKFMGMSHIYSFAITAAILLLAHNYYSKPDRYTLFLLAFLSGWATLIRPTNCVLIITLLLLQITSLQDFKNRLRFIGGKMRDITMAIPLFFLPMIPQLLYWKEVLGKWVVYSYKGESFIYWNHPKILAVLFDPQNGLFLYSPIILFSIPALILGKKDKRVNSTSVIVTFMMITYIFSSWWCWNFGGAFGHRCYIDYLPLFAFPFAYTIERILMIKTGYIKNFVFIILFFLAYYGVAMSFLYDKEYITQQWNWDGFIHLLKQII